MSEFEIYVKSSALGKTGIHWRKIDEDNQPAEEPRLIRDEVIKKSKNNQLAIVNDLIDQSKPSLLIFRGKDKLLLEITGIESPQRSKQLGRKVLNSVVWIADDLKEKEKFIRKIAYLTIKKILKKDLFFFEEIGELIHFSNKEEFKVDLAKLKELIYRETEHIHCREEIPEKVEEISKIKDKSTEYFLEELAKEILNNSFPKDWTDWDEKPKQDGVLVVVTENLEIKTILHNAGVWRGYASNVEEPEPNEPEKKKNAQTMQSCEPSQMEKPQILLSPNPNLRIAMLVILLGATLMIVIFLSLKPQKIPQPQTQEQKILKTQTIQIPQNQAQSENTQGQQIPVCQPLTLQIQTQKKDIQDQQQIPLCQPHSIQTPQIQAQAQQEETQQNQLVEP